MLTQKYKYKLIFFIFFFFVLLLISIPQPIFSADTKQQGSGYCFCKIKGREEPRDSGVACLAGADCSDSCEKILEFSEELESSWCELLPQKKEEEKVPTYELESPIKAETIPELIGSIIKAILGIVGALALLMFVYGGFVWLTSGGSADKIKKGKDIIVWATIGLIVIFASYALVSFVIRAIGG